MSKHSGPSPVGMLFCFSERASHHVPSRHVASAAAPHGRHRSDEHVAHAALTGQPDPARPGQSPPSFRCRSLFPGWSSPWGTLGQETAVEICRRPHTLGDSQTDFASVFFRCTVWEKVGQLWSLGHLPGSRQARCSFRGCCLAHSSEDASACLPTHLERERCLLETEEDSTQGSAGLHSGSKLGTSVASRGRSAADVGSRRRRAAAVG